MPGLAKDVCYTVLWPGRDVHTPSLQRRCGVARLWCQPAPRSFQHGDAIHSDAVVGEQEFLGFVPDVPDVTEGAHAVNLELEQDGEAMAYWIAVTIVRKARACGPGRSIGTGAPEPGQRERVRCRPCWEYNSP